MLFPPLNFQQWIDDNRHLLKPPVGNKCVWPGGEFIVMVVGGPNQRADYHVNGTPEFFYQVEGDMVLRIRENGLPKDIPIKQGEIFLLPSGVPHSPQRGANTVGLVIEQTRPGEMQDGLHWYCDSCNGLMYEEYFPLQNVEKDFPPVFERFWNEHSTCPHCGTQKVRG